MSSPRRDVACARLWHPSGEPGKDGVCPYCPAALGGSTKFTVVVVVVATGVVATTGAAALGVDSGKAAVPEAGAAGTAFAAISIADCRGFFHRLNTLHNCCKRPSRSLRCCFHRGH